MIREVLKHWLTSNGQMGFKYSKVDGTKSGDILSPPPAPFLRIRLDFCGDVGFKKRCLDDRCIMNWWN